MSRPASLKVKKWISSEELKEQIRRKERDLKVLNRLHFINYLYDGCSVPEASEKLGMTKQAGYIWLERLNRDAYDGLIPRFAGGRPSKITDSQKSDLKELLKERDDWTTKEVRNLIQSKFGVDYSLKQVRIILKEMGLKFGKPYPYDYRQPDNAEEQFKKTLN
jgi:putative transposase